MAGTYGESGWTYGQTAITYGGGDVVIPPTVIVGPTQDTDDLLSLTTVRQRVDCFRFELVDASGAAVGDIHPIRSDSPVNVANDTTRTAFRSMTNFQLDANEATQINPASDWVRPSLVLQNGAAFPLGVFLFNDDSKAVRSWGTETSGTLIDQTFVLDQSIGRNLSVANGQNAVQTAANIAAEVIHSPIIVTPSILPVGAPLGWKLDVSRLKIMNDLLALASYFPPYFDNMGRLILRPCVHPPFFTVLPPYEAATRIIKDSQVLSDDLLRAPNRYIVYDSGSTSSAIRGTFDIPAAAPNSYDSRGFRVVKAISKQGLTGTPQAEAMAMTEYHTDVNQFRTVEFDSTADPRHDTFDIVQYLGDQYLELGWSMELRSGGRMGHKLRKLYEG